MNLSCQPVRLIVSFAADGPTAVLARVVSEKLAQMMRFHVRSEP